MTRDEALGAAGKASEVYFGIQKFIMQHGYGPTLDELMSVTSIRSKKTILRYVRSLQDLNLVSGEIKKSRTLGLVGYTYIDTDDGTIEYGKKGECENVRKE